MNDKTPQIDLEFEEVVSDTPEAAPQEPEVPEKYRGKSVMDLIEMHRNAEKALSRQGQDLAEQRRLTDQILGLKKENVEAPQEPVRVTPDEVFTDPNTAIEKLIKSSEVTKKTDEIAERLNSLERGIGQKEFETRHPTFMKDVEDKEFLDWVAKNKSRTELLARLHYQYDFNAGNDLWDMWTEVKGSRTETPKADKLKAARTVKSGPADSSSKPVYSRAKLLALQADAQRGDPAARQKWNDPAFQAEYLEAYREGRIK